MNFDLDTISPEGFGIGTRERGRLIFLDVPVDKNIDNNLVDMVSRTWAMMLALEETPDRYDPADGSGGRRHLSVPIGDDAAGVFRDLNEADRFDPGGGTLVNQPQRISCYFGRFMDSVGNRLTGVRLPTGFKGIMRHKRSLVSWADDTLQITEDNIFKLDTDFDLLVAPDEIRILRPRAFETIGRLQELIRLAVPRNIDVLQESLGFVDFAPIADFAANSVEAARLLASIRNKQTDGIDIDYLMESCQNNGIRYSFDGEQLKVEDDSALGFLRTLNRNRLNVELIPGTIEVYDATGTRRV